jgi:hypothetical protein
MTDRTATGGSVYNVGPTGWYKFYDTQGYGLSGWHICAPVDVRKTVSLGLAPGGTFRHAWGRGVNSQSTGWSNEPYNYETGFCEVVSTTGTTATLRTYIFYEYNLLGQWIATHPCQPGQLVYAYTILRGPGMGPAAGGTALAKAGAPATGVPSVADMPQEHALDQNSPNPFGRVTDIRFQLPGASYVSIRVFDLQGREVARPLEGDLAAGYHAVSWEPGELPDGVYVCRLEAGPFVGCRRMALVR